MSWESADAPRRRWVPPVAAIVAALLLLGAAAALRRDDQPAQLDVSETPSPAADDRIAPQQPSRPLRMRRSIDVTGRGPLVPEAPDLTIVAADFVSRLQQVEVASGDVRALQVFPAGTRARPDAVRVVGDSVILDTAGDVVLVVEDQPSPTVLALGHRSIPTDDDATLWVYDGLDGRVGGTATQIAFDGTVLHQIPMPALAQPLAGTADSLIVRTPSGVTGIDRDGARREIARGQGLASDGTRIAVLDCSAELTCFVALGTLDDPYRVRVQLGPDDLPAGLAETPSGTFSPDGRWFALPVYRVHRTGRVAEARVSIIDVTLGAEARRVRGSPLTAPDTPVAWSPDSRWLAISTGSRVRLWSAASNEVTELDVGLWPTYALAAR